MSTRAGGSPTTRPARGLWIVGTVVVVIGLALVIALAAGNHRKKPHAALAPVSLVKKVSSVPTSVFARVGTGTAAGAPKAITATALTAGGKPQILYVGAEYCPYCATERWPMVIALSRFGKFVHLKTTHSSSTDSFPNTATFSFHNSEYTSPYVSFSGVELSTNQPQGDGYAPLDKLTAAEQKIYSKYDAPPYTDQAGTIPFIDFGGKFLQNGVSYDPSVLSGMSATEIADALSDPKSAVSKGAVGVANIFTAAICDLTDNQPTKVCTTPVIQQLQGKP